MTALAMKSKGTWLNWSVWAGDVQPKSRVKPAAEPKIAIRPHDRSPSTRHSLSKSLDRHAKPVQTGKNGILLGECRVDEFYPARNQAEWIDAGMTQYTWVIRPETHFPRRLY